LDDVGQCRYVLSGKIANLLKGLGAPGRTRTASLLIRSQMLYPIELRAQRMPAGARFARARAGKGRKLIKARGEGKRAGVKIGKD
jgi:hypothetical protein